jgi:hypothetical protein
LSPKEQLHLRHTVFRIDSLLCLYNTLSRRPHSTELGVLLGAITHLLDYAYDHGHRQAVPTAVADVEDVVYQVKAPDSGDELQVALASLAARAWRLVPDPDSFAPWLNRMVATQQRSLAQDSGPPMDRTTLDVLTRDKGHHSLCLYFAAVNPTFDEDEAEALRPFGAYMQYMDDLEDIHEDRAEGRQSLIRGILPGALRATAAFVRALMPMFHYYRGRPERYNHRMFVAWLLLFHVGILVALATREATRLLPMRVQVAMDRYRERLAARVPLLHVVPLSAAQTIGRSDA